MFTAGTQKKPLPRWKIPREMVWSACIQWFYSNLAGYVKCGAFSTMKFLWKWMKLDHMIMIPNDSYWLICFRWLKNHQKSSNFRGSPGASGSGLRKPLGCVMVAKWCWTICGSNGPDWPLFWSAVFFLQYSVGPLTSRFFFFLRLGDFNSCLMFGCGLDALVIHLCITSLLIENFVNYHCFLFMFACIFGMKQPNQENSFTYI